MPVQVQFDENPPDPCASAIVVPPKALTEAGHIRTFTVNPGAQSKHEFYALAQTALLQFEDEELQPVRCEHPIRVVTEDEAVEIEEGAVIGRLVDGQVAVWSAGDRPVRKFLEAANRFCTRWIRLDL